MNQRLSIKQVWLIMGILALLIAALVYSFWVRPDVASARLMQSQITEANQQLAQVKHTETTTAVSQSDMQVLLSAVPDNPDQPQVLTTLEEMASSTSVEEQDVTFANTLVASRNATALGQSGVIGQSQGTTQAGGTSSSTTSSSVGGSGTVGSSVNTGATGDFHSFSIDLTVSGSIDNVSSYLTEVQAASRYFSVTSVQMLPSSGPSVIHAASGAPSGAKKASRASGVRYVEAKISMNVYDDPSLSGIASYLSANQK